jgi:hypothetical protein
MQSLLLDKTEPLPTRPDLKWPDSQLEGAKSLTESGRFGKIQQLYNREISLKPFEFRETYIDVLPDNWRVCSISIDEERDDILVSRIRKGTDPVIVRLPIRRQANRDNGNEDCLGFKAAMSEFREILASSDTTLQQTAAGMSRADRVEWWNTRKELDERLENLLYQIETTWMGAFKVGSLRYFVEDCSLSASSRS